MPVNVVTSFGTVVPSRLSPATASSSVNTNRPTLNRTSASRSSVVAITRGVSWPPAIWIATSSEPKVKTRKDSDSVMTAWYMVVAPVTDSPVRFQSR